jgi:hypothetical protein
MDLDSDECDEIEEKDNCVCGKSNLMQWEIVFP